MSHMLSYQCLSDVIIQLMHSFEVNIRICPCADPESFVRGGPTLTTFFFSVDEGREDQNTTISGPSSALQ